MSMSLRLRLHECMGAGPGNGIAQLEAVKLLRGHSFISTFNSYREAFLNLFSYMDPITMSLFVG